VTVSRRIRAVAAGACLAAVLAVAGITTVALVPESAPASAGTTERTTAPVTRGDLVERISAAGTVGYGTAQDLVAPGGGTVTWLPAPGDVIRRDGVLYRVDERPVRAMIGNVPVYRDLVTGLWGSDVRQLNENLAALGYGVPTDDRFGAGTLSAVRRYQKDRGMTVTGGLGTSDIVFLPGDVRVAAVRTAVGSPAGGPVLSVTGDERVVTFTVPATDAGRVTVGTRVDGTITGRGDPLPGEVTASEPTTKEGKDVVTVTVRLDPTDRTLPDSGSALVRVTGETREDVLSVPVTALRPGARADEYAVDVATADGAARRVRVRPGLVADGRVEVTGQLRVGDRVVVPS
jgi:multidrug efflux pump subunit AcrA (membrane-fusion protein)